MCLAYVDNICECFPLFRKGLRDVTYGWVLVYLVSLLAWVLTIVVQQDCTFVKIGTSDGSSSFGRGLTRGRLTPDDSCQIWGNYSELKLDSSAVASLFAAYTSVAVGAFVVFYLLISVCCQPFPWFFKWIVAVLCVVVAGLQAMTHTMTKSDLCKGVSFTFEDVLFDECSKKTVAYNLTFATIAIWVVLAILFPFVRLHKLKQDNEDDQMAQDSAA